MKKLKLGLAVLILIAAGIFAASPKAAETLIQAIRVDTQQLYLRQRTAAPANLVQGLVMYADGTTWNPGQGAGFYYYNGSAWKLILPAAGAVSSPTGTSIPLSGPTGTIAAGWLGTVNAVTSTPTATAIPVSGPTGTLNPNWIGKQPFGTFSYFYESSQQTITSAGSLTLTHGLGAQPTLVQLWLVCQTAEAGYSAGDWVRAENNDASGNNSVGIRATSTNLYIIFSSNANVFTTLNPATGNALGLTNANWKAVFRAWR